MPRAQYQARSFEPKLVALREHIRKIVIEYVDFYNHHRPPQGIDRIPVEKHMLGLGISRRIKLLTGCTLITTGSVHGVAT